VKIIGIDNFDRDNVSDILIAENVNEYYGKIIIKFLQECCTSQDLYFPRLVPDDHKLYKFEV